MQLCRHFVGSCSVAVNSMQTTCFFDEFLCNFVVGILYELVVLYSVAVSHLVLVLMALALFLKGIHPDIFLAFAVLFVSITLSTTSYRKRKRKRLDEIKT